MHHGSQADINQYGVYRTSPFWKWGLHVEPSNCNLLATVVALLSCVSIRFNCAFNLFLGAVNCSYSSYCGSKCSVSAAGVLAL